MPKKQYNSQLSYPTWCQDTNDSNPEINPLPSLSFSRTFNPADYAEPAQTEDGYAGGSTWNNTGSAEMEEATSEKIIQDYPQLYENYLCISEKITLLYFDPMINSQSNINNATILHILEYIIILELKYLLLNEG